MRRAAYSVVREVSLAEVVALEAGHQEQGEEEGEQAYLTVYVQR
jgi:hypothetical protein